MALVLLGLTAACTAYNPDLVDDIEVVRHEYEAVRAMTPQGPLFFQGLRQGYLDYSDLQYSGAEFQDFVHFAFKAVDSAKGDMVLPDELAGRKITAEQQNELAAGRARLMTALDHNGRKRAPEDASGAQVAFDCWLDRAEEGAAPELIQECKGRFEQQVAAVEEGMTRTEDEAYLVFFAWDQAELSPVAQTVLDQIKADYAGRTPQGVIVAGHADRSGPDAYNERLSKQRARAVAEGLVGRGIAGQAIEVEWFGETQPRVIQADGTQEPQNRRVEVRFR